MLVRMLQCILARRLECWQGGWNAVTDFFIDIKGGDKGIFKDVVEMHFNL